MFNSWKQEATTLIALLLAVCWVVYPKKLAAESGPRVRHVLVVAANESDANCLKRIGREYVSVEGLFAPYVNASTQNYEACNKRVLGLLEFRLFVFRGDNSCPTEGFWRERLTAANPRGQVHRLSRLRCHSDDDCQGRIQQAIDIHGALVAILPEHRTALDANLKSEVLRLHSRGLDPTQFALSK